MSCSIHYFCIDLQAESDHIILDKFKITYIVWYNFLTSSNFFDFFPQSEKINLVFKKKICYTIFISYDQ